MKILLSGTLGLLAFATLPAPGQNAPTPPASAPTQPSNRSGNPNLDQTRRELLELPTATQPPGPNSTRILPNVAGPELPASSPLYAPPPSTPEQSPTWLAGAMRQTELNSRRGSASPCR